MPPLSIKAAQDWPHIERLAKKYLESCKRVVDSEDYSDAYHDIAWANLQMDNPEAALAACEKCIEIFYSNPACHETKVEVLIRLKRLAEARYELEITEKLIDYLTKNSEVDLDSTPDPEIKGLYKEKKEIFIELKGRLDKICHIFKF